MTARAAPPTGYEKRLGDGLKQTFAAGANDLPDFIKKPNDIGS